MLKHNAMKVKGPGMAHDLSDPAVFERVYDEHSRSVYAAAYRILGNAAQAQDVVQDVFLRLWRRPKTFDAARGELGPYVRMMARSRALDLWREGQAAGRASDRLKLAVAQEPRDEDDRPSTHVERGEDAATVRAAVRRLPEAQREAVVMAYWGGLTADEIARKIEVPLGTAKSRIRLGLEKLRTEGGVAVRPDLAAAA
jgi:RNA polymerase sigma-70 factor (ECF subfamily)